MINVRDVGGAATVANATQRWSHRRGLFVEVSDQDGCVGLGETSPLEGISGETLEQARSELAGLANLGASELEEISLSSGSRFALETALLDLTARQTGASIAALLVDEPLPVQASALLGDPRGPRPFRAELVCAKLKVGPASEWRAQALAIEQLVDDRPDLALRLDFNGSLGLTEATEIVAELADRGWHIDYVEDPVSHDNLRQLHSPIDVAVDHMLTQPNGVAHALELARLGRAQVAVLKPALLGGLRRTFASAEELTTKMDVVVSHLLDGPVALAAYAELACAIATLRSPVRAAGVGPHAALAAYPSMHIAQLDDDGWLRPLAHRRP